MYRVASLKRGGKKSSAWMWGLNKQSEEGSTVANIFLFPFSFVRFGDKWKGLLWRLATVIHVNAHDFPAVFALTGHKIKVWLIGLSGNAAGVVRVVLRSLIMIPAILGVVARLNGRGVPSSRGTRQTVSRTGPYHPRRALDGVCAQTISSHFSVPW